MQILTFSKRKEAIKKLVGGSSNKHQLAPGEEEAREQEAQEVADSFQDLLDQSDKILGITPKKRKREEEQEESATTEPPKVQEFRGAETYTTVTVSEMDDDQPEKEGNDDDDDDDEEGNTSKQRKKPRPEVDDSDLPEVGFPFRVVAGIEGGKELMKQLSGKANKKPKYKPKAHWNRKKAFKAKKHKRIERKKGAGSK